VQPLGPIDVVPLFPEERAALLDLLRSLGAEQWATPTVCPGWSVKDIASHLVADDFGRLGWQRDGYSENRFRPTSPEAFEEELRVFVNQINNSWVDATRRLSPRILIDLLEWTGRETQSLFESLDPHGMGLGVAWAGERESANWFDLAREYTERWHHQAQMRDAVGAPLLYEERLFGPVIDTKVRAIPHALSDRQAAVGATIRVRLTGQLERTYDIVCRDSGWQACVAGEREPAAIVTMDADMAWRLLTRNLPRATIVERCAIDGDARLGEAVFDSFALVA
jgi:uncharacterized protein (TIGR03083 family)